MAYDLAPERTGVVLLVGAERVGAGDGVARPGTPPDMCRAACELLGRVLDPLGNLLDDGPRCRPAPAAGVPRRAGAHRARAGRLPARRPGVMAIDAAIPIGRGQRQLIVGDRNVGKTALALDIVARPAARRRGLRVRGDRPADVARAVAPRGAATPGRLDNTVIVAADAADSARAAVPRALRRRRDRRVLPRPGPRRAGRLRRPDQARRRLPRAGAAAGPPAGARGVPGDIFYIHARAAGARGARAGPRPAAARSPRSRWSRPPTATSPRTSRPT